MMPSNNSNNSPCAACKFLRRKCTTECAFAPYFPPDHPERFADVHKVFGASNVSKLLNNISPPNREAAVTGLFFEARKRIQDPVHGCTAHINELYGELNELYDLIKNAMNELATYSPPYPHPQLHHYLEMPALPPSSKQQQLPTAFAPPQQLSAVQQYQQLSANAVQPREQQPSEHRTLPLQRKISSCHHHHYQEMMHAASPSASQQLQQLSASASAAGAAQQHMQFSAARPVKTEGQLHCTKQPMMMPLPPPQQQREQVVTGYEAELQSREKAFVEAFKAGGGGCRSYLHGDGGEPHSS
ncbi:hypothetical protein AMTRI_Chr13g91280 [Amborella trichopoda]